METFRLEEYLSNGVEQMIKGILKASAGNPRESLFMVQYARGGRKRRELRRKREEEGVHIPPFLIASITNQCNLNCKGCYARENEKREGFRVKRMLTVKEWGNIFEEAQKLGVGFVLLAGGEPMTRRDVLREAGEYKGILFPVFTNGTLFDKDYAKLFGIHKNLIPILSVEGGEGRTDDRRGGGIYRRVQRTMELLQNSRILFGASVTVTKENLEEVTGENFLKELRTPGCKGIIYVEYVPVDRKSASLALEERDRQYMNSRIQRLRNGQDEMLYISFPGDEKSSGGCLAAGRGFFHINAAGDAEPCPFSPFSDTSLLDMSLEDALHSPLFRKLQTSGLLTAPHEGGCVLYQHEVKVENLLKGGSR